MNDKLSKRGLFVGMITCDIIYRCDRLPRQNEKLITEGALVTAGGPAANAAVTFARLGGHAFLAGTLGSSTVAAIVRQELEERRVTILDATPKRREPPPVASIIVNTQSGDRAVLSLPPHNLEQKDAEVFAETIDIPTPDIILADGHQAHLSASFSKRYAHTPLVLDVGNPKPAFATLWGMSEYALCSEDFRPAGCQTEKDVFHYLSARGVPHTAITRGERPILYRHNDVQGSIPIKKVAVVDTTGAGDAFHGAFCFHIIGLSFAQALELAACEATHSVTYAGTRPPGLPT